MSAAAALRDDVSLQEWLDMWVHDDRVHELVRGSLILAPSERAQNIRAASRLVRLIEDSLEAEVEGLPGLGVLVQGDPAPTVRRPDVVIVPADLGVMDYQVPASDVLMVVEVLSPSTALVDERDKVREYAEAGIGVYLLVDVRNPLSATMTLYTDPAPGGYGARTQGSQLIIPLGTGVLVDVQDLQRRR